MRRHLILAAPALAVALLAGHALSAADAPSVPARSSTGSFDARGFDGTWDRYPLPTDAQRDPTTVPIPRAADIPPPPLKPQYKPEWEAKRKKVQEANARGEPIANEYTACMPDGMPTMMQAMFPMEVVTNKRQMTIIQEAYNQVRRIYFNEKLPPIEDAEPGFWGHSSGHWEGDTLVVDTIGIKDYVLFRDVPHSANMRINERMKMLDANHFENVVTVTDPEYLEKPWTWKWIYQRRPNYKMFEYVCEQNHEFADPQTGAQRMKITPPPSKK
jgi:hypothetical protein